MIILRIIGCQIVMRNNQPKMPRANADCRVSKWAKEQDIWRKKQEGRLSIGIQHSALGIRLAGFNQKPQHKYQERS